MRRILKESCVWVVLGVGTASGVFLVRQNRALASQNQVLIGRAVEPHAGLYVPAYDATTLEGTPVTLGKLGERQVLIFFRTTCPFCRASTPALNTLAQRLQTQPEIAVYGVALDSAGAARNYVAERELHFPVISRPDPRLVGLYRVSSVPLILVLNRDGRMAYVRLGVLDSTAAVDSVVAAALVQSAASPQAEGQTAGLRRARRRPY